jgi:hypothetical protein
MPPPTKFPVCFGHFSNNTASKPKPKDAKSPTHQFSVVLLRISENEPPRETHIITLTTRAHRFQKPHPHTNHNPIRPRAPPTKFRPYSCTFQARRPQSPKMPRAPPTKFPLCCYEFQKTNHHEKLTSSPWQRRHTVMKRPTQTPKKASPPGGWELRGHARSIPTGLTAGACEPRGHAQSTRKGFIPGGWELRGHAQSTRKSFTPGFWEP